MMTRLKVYADRMSQPSRAVLLFCRLNRLDFDEIKVDISKRQQLSSEFKENHPSNTTITLNTEADYTKKKRISVSIYDPQRVPWSVDCSFDLIQEINPMQKVPAIAHGAFNLFESHAILIYLATAFPGIADHWYPADIYRRAKINSVLDWHHSNLRHGAVTYVINTVLAPALGQPLNPQAAAEAEKVLLSSLSKLEDIWLNGDGGFLLGGFQPSIADISMVCELMQLEVLDEKDRSRILTPYKKVLKWIEDTRTATNPHFDEVHNILFKAKRKFQEQRLREANSRTKPNTKMGGGLSKM